MALTRAQLLAGDTSTGTPVLNGQVQGVRQGTGVLILPDGTINFDASTAVGVMRLNDPNAYNAYVWPVLGGPPAAGNILQTDGTGQLVWTGNYVPTIGTTSLNAAQGAAQLPVGLNAQRPLAAAGLIRYNSEQGVLEYHDGTSWVSVVSSSPTSPTVGFGLAVDGTAIKVSIACTNPAPAVGSLPTEAIDGSLYWDDNLGLLFIYYNDGTSSQWVQVTPSGGGGGGTGTVTSVGITGTGGITSLGGPITSSGIITVGFSVSGLPVLP